MTKQLMNQLLLGLLLFFPLFVESAQLTTYSVWEVEIQEGASIAGQRYRLAVVDWPFGDVAQNIEFGRDRLYIKDRSLGDVGLGTHEIASWKKGEEKSLTRHHQTFRSLFSYEPIELARLKTQKEVRFSLRLIKSCPAKIETLTKSVWGSNTSGIITIPKRVKQTVTEIDTPSCYDKSDRVLKLPPVTIQSEALKAQIAQGAKEDAEKKATQDRNQRAQDIERKLEGSAYKLAKEPMMKEAAAIPESDRSLEAIVKRKVCPAMPALMKSLQVKAVELGRQVVKGKTHDGYHTETHTTLGHLVLEDDSTVDMKHMLMHSYFLDIKSIILEPGGCVKVVLMPSVNPTEGELEKSIKAIQDVLKRYLRDLAYERSEKP